MKTLITFLIMILSLELLADNGSGSIQGIVSDESLNNIPGATVMVLKLSDSSYVRAISTEADGSFNIQKIDRGTYIVKVKYIGYEDKYVGPIVMENERTCINLSQVKIREQLQSLKEIEVVAEVPLLEMKQGKATVNVEKNSVFVNTNLTEVLEKCPGVNLNKDGEILLNGKKDVMILMDGKPLYVKGSELQNVLKGMQSAQITKIEISNNASSKFDASGNGGIINIITRKNYLQGFSASVNLSYGQGRYFKNNNGFNLGYRSNKLNLLLSYSFSARRGYSEMIIKRDIKTDSTQFIVHSYTYSRFPINTHTPRLNIDFPISKKVSYSGILSGILNQFNPEQSGTASIQHNQAISSRNMQFATQEYFGNIGSSNQIALEIDTLGRKLTFDIDYIKHFYKSKQNQFFQYYNNPEQHDVLTGDQNGNVKIISLKSDYTYISKHSCKVETGIKSVTIKTKNDNKFFVNGDLNKVDSGRSNNYLYSEMVNAAYVNTNKNFGKINLEAGIRIEYTNISGNQRLTGEKFSIGYIQMFPFLNINRTGTNTNSFGISFGRRVGRPSYQQLNPYRFYIDATSYDKGNPKLRPQTTEVAEVNCSFKGKLNIATGYNRVSNLIGQVITSETQTDNVTLQTWENVGVYHYLFGTIMFTDKFKNILRTNNSITVYNGYMKPNKNQFRYDNMISYNLSTVNSVILKRGFTIDITGRYNSRYIDALTKMIPSYAVNIGVSKSFFDKKGNVSITYNDIFKTVIMGGVTATNLVNEDWINYRDTRVVSVNFTYRFGRGSSFKLRRSSGADNEKNRL